MAIGISSYTQYFLNLAVQIKLDTYRVNLAFVPVNVNVRFSTDCCRGR